MGVLIGNIGLTSNGALKGVLNRAGMKYLSSEDWKGLKMHHSNHVEFAGNLPKGQSIVRGYASKGLNLLGRCFDSAMALESVGQREKNLCLVFPVLIAGSCFILCLVIDHAAQNVAGFVLGGAKL